MEPNREANANNMSNEMSTGKCAMSVNKWIINLILTIPIRDVMKILFSQIYTSAVFCWSEKISTNSQLNSPLKKWELKIRVPVLCECVVFSLFRCCLWDIIKWLLNIVNFRFTNFTHVRIVLIYRVMLSTFAYFTRRRS